MTVLPLFPLNAVLFPGATMSLHVFEPRYRGLIGRCRQNREAFGIALIRAGHEVGGPAVPHDVGTEATLVAVEDLSDGRMNILVEGGRRFRIARLLPGKAYLEAEVEFLEEPAGDASAWRRKVLEILPLSGEDAPADDVVFSYRLAEFITANPAEKQELLEAHDAELRLEREANLLARTRRQSLA